MVVLTDKELLPPPPPYFAVEHAQSSVSLATSVLSGVGPSGRTVRRIAPKLPSHVLLQVVYKTLERKRPRDPESEEDRIRRTTRTLYWIGTNLRQVNRGFYLASMHLLRSTYLPFYASQIKAPYSSDPFPHTSPSSFASSPSSTARTSVIRSLQRESQILDLFLLFKLHEDVFTDDSVLHLERDDTLRDLFDFMQPRARLEDLIRDYGVAAGLVHVTPPRDASKRNASASTGANSPYATSVAGGNPSTSRLSVCTSTTTLPPPFASTASLAISPSKPSSSAYASSSSSTSTVAHRISSQSYVHTQAPTCIHPHALPFSQLSVSFSTRRVGLALSTQGRKRTIVETDRERSEPLERCASRLVVALKGWLDSAGR